MTFVHQYSLFYFKKITICVNRQYICIYTIDLILFCNVDENLVVFDDFQIITFNTFYLSLYSMILLFNKEQSLIHVHSRNLMHCVLIHVLHQPHVCHCWIEFGLINIFLLFNYLTTFASQHHGPFTHANFCWGLLSPLATSLLLKHCGIVKNISHFVLGHCSNSYLLIIILWYNHPLFQVITYSLMIITKVLHFHP